MYLRIDFALGDAYIGMRSHVLEVMGLHLSLDECPWEQHGTVEHCQRRPLNVGVVCGDVRRPDGDEGAAALVFFVADCPAVPFSLGAFGWAARFVGTLLFASLPIAFQNCAPSKRLFKENP